MGSPALVQRLGFVLHPLRQAFPPHPAEHERFAKTPCPAGFGAVRVFHEQAMSLLFITRSRESEVTNDGPSAASVVNVA